MERREDETDTVETITYQARTINKTTVMQEIGTYYDLEKRPDKTNIVRMD